MRDSTIRPVTVRDNKTCHTARQQDLSHCSTIRRVTVRDNKTCQLSQYATTRPVTVRDNKTCHSARPNDLSRCADTGAKHGQLIFCNYRVWITSKTFLDYFPSVHLNVFKKNNHSKTNTTSGKIQKIQIHKKGI